MVGAGVGDLRRQSRVQVEVRVAQGLEQFGDPGTTNAVSE
jgi:hypothetical protein